MDLLILDSKKWSGRDEEPIFEIDENQSENHLRMILGKCRKEGIPIATYKRKSE